MASIDTKTLRGLANGWNEEAAFIKTTWPETGLPLEGSEADVQIYCIHGCSGSLLKAIEAAETAEGVANQVLDAQKEERGS